MTILKLDPKEAHKRQKAYVDSIGEAGFDVGLVVGNAFVESIRDLGYRSTGGEHPRRVWVPRGLPQAGRHRDH